MGQKDTQTYEAVTAAAIAFYSSFQVLRRSSSYRNWHLEIHLNHLDPEWLNRMEASSDLAQQTEMG